MLVEDTLELTLPETLDAALEVVELAADSDEAAVDKSVDVEDSAEMAETKSSNDSGSFVTNILRVSAFRLVTNKPRRMKMRGVCGGGMNERFRGWERTWKCINSKRVLFLATRS